MDTAVGSERTVARIEARGLAWYGLPGHAGVRAAIEVGHRVRNAHVDDRGGAAGGAARLDEIHEDDADAVSAGVPRDREARNLAPVGAVIGALPEAVEAGAEVHNAAEVGVDRKALAGVAAVVIAAQRDGYGHGLERVALIGGHQDSAVSGRFGVSSDGQVEAGGIRRVETDALHPDIVLLGRADPIEQGYPRAGGGVPAIRPADVGAGINEVGLGGVEDNPIDEAAGYDLDVVPDVGRRRERRDGVRSRTDGAVGVPAGGGHGVDRLGGGNRDRRAVDGGGGSRRGAVRGVVDRRAGRGVRDGHALGGNVGACGHAEHWYRNLRNGRRSRRRGRGAARSAAAASVESEQRD